MINTSVYGTAAQWQDCLFDYGADPDHKNKKAWFADAGVEASSMLFQGVNADKLSYDTHIDKSISFCGLGRECALSHVSYISTDRNDTSTVAICDTQDRAITNFAFFEKNGGNSPIYRRFINPNQLDRVAWINNPNLTWNISPFLSPWTLVNPKNFVLLIGVIASTGLGGNVINTDLKTYMSQYKETHPYIINANIGCFYGQENIGGTYRSNYATGVTQFQIPFYMSIIDNYTSNVLNLDIPVYGLYGNVVFGSQNDTININYDSVGQYIYPCYTTERGKNHIKCGTSGDSKYLYIEYYDGFEDDVIQTVACFGVYFTTSATVAREGLLTDTDMYIGLLDSDGIGHGEYLRGVNTVNAPQAANNFTDMSQSGYDYTKDVDKTKYQNGTQFNLNVETSAFNKFYALTKADVTQLANELYSIANDVPSGVSVTEYNMKTFLTNNPIDCIISLKKFPVKNIPLIGTPNNIYLGAKQTDILGCEVLAKTFVYYFNFSAANDTSLYPVNGDTFLDYEPYTKCTIVVPFCGSTEIPCSYMYEYGGCTVALMIDFVTGACTAFIMVNGNTIETLHGNCAINLPVSGIQSATLDANVNSTVQNYNSTAISSAISVIGGGLSFIIGAASLNPMMMLGGAAAIATGAIKGELAEQKTTYELQHMQTPFKSVSAASGAIAQSGDLRCKLLISRPKISPGYDATVYANTIGFACLDNTTVDKLSGLTIGDINLNGIQATDIEKQLIKKAFESGVIL